MLAITHLWTLVRETAIPLLSLLAVAITQWLDYGGLEAAQTGLYAGFLTILGQAVRQIFVGPEPKPKRRTTRPKSRKPRRSSTKGAS